MMRGDAAPALRRSTGQATVELVLALPLVVLVLLAVIQVALVARTQLVLVHAAREAARAAAVEHTAAAARRGALGGGLHPDRLEVEVDIGTGDGGLAHAALRYRCPTDVPIIGRLMGDPVLSAELVMRVEPSADQAGPSP